jgi:tRNA A-37 threonylcarbamoyl transferase component Bud32
LVSAVYRQSVDERAPEPEQWGENVVTDGLSRRAVLRTVATGVALSGSAGIGAGRGDRSESWPPSGDDETNTGRAREHTNPEPGGGESRRFRTDGKVRSSPAAVEGTAIGGHDDTVYATGGGTLTSASSTEPLSPDGELFAESDSRTEGPAGDDGRPVPGGVVGVSDPSSWIVLVLVSVSVLAAGILGAVRLRNRGRDDDGRSDGTPPATPSGPSRSTSGTPPADGDVTADAHLTAGDHLRADARALLGDDTDRALTLAEQARVAYEEARRMAPTPDAPATADERIEELDAMVSEAPANDTPSVAKTPGYAATLEALPEQVRGHVEDGVGRDERFVSAVETLGTLRANTWLVLTTDRLVEVDDNLYDTTESTEDDPARVAFEWSDDDLPRVRVASDDGTVSTFDLRAAPDQFFRDLIRTRPELSVDPPESVDATDPSSVSDDTEAPRDRSGAALTDARTAANDGAVDDALDRRAATRLCARLDRAERRLEEIRDDIETESVPTLRTRLDDATESVDAVAKTAENMDDDRLRTRVSALRSRANSCRDAIDLRASVDDVRRRVDDALDRVADDPAQAREQLVAIEDDLETIARRVDATGIERFDTTVGTLRERCRTGIDRATELLRNRPPETIPTVANVDVDYAALERQDFLGKGGNADVYLVRTTGTDRAHELAVKEPRMVGTLHTGTVERLMEEAETWDKLDDHDHIVGVVDYDADPLPWIAMEYMDAGDLADRAGELEFDQTLWTAIGVTKGVRHAHRHGIAHLDLKPKNVLFRSVEDGWDVPKVADWGLSKQLLEHSKSLEGLSPQYAAPEQFDESYGSTDDITDVYQLGAVFYELFTGRPPFEGPPTKVMRRVLDEEPTPPSDVASVPSALDDVLLTALEKRKHDRYESALLLRNELRDLRES